MHPDVKDVLHRLTDEEARDLEASLVARLKSDSQDMAVLYADLLESNLRLMGLPEDAEAVRVVRRKIQALNFNT